MGLSCFCFFFFSSRRRHTRWPRDWSSDVCSSDLGVLMDPILLLALVVGIALIVVIVLRTRLDAFAGLLIASVVVGLIAGQSLPGIEIGRASCRGREWSWGAAGGVGGRERQGERVN